MLNAVRPMTSAATPVAAFSISDRASTACFRPVASSPCSPHVDPIRSSAPIRLVVVPPAVASARWGVPVASARWGVPVASARWGVPVASASWGRLNEQALAAA
jgi:hypothetical protein